MKHLIFFLILVSIATQVMCTNINYSAAQQLLYMTVTPALTTIGVTTSYNFIIDRTIDQSGSYLDSSSILTVPQSSNIGILFPSQYNSSVSSYNCSPITLTLNGVSNSTCNPTTCLATGRNLTIGGCFTSSALNVTQAYITIGNITNPIPAITIDSFIGYIGVDYTSSVGVFGVPTFTLTPASMSCSIAFNPTTVNTLSTMTVSITPNHSIPASTGSVTIQFPTTGYWSNSINNASIIPSTSLTCLNLSTNIASPVCTATSSLVTLSGLSTTISISSNFNFSVSQILSPPSPQLVDTVIITTLSNSSQLDRCSTSISGLTAQSIAVSITSGSTLTVNRQVALRLLPTILSPIYASTDWKFQLVFPTGSIFTATSVSMLTYTFTGLTNDTTSVSWTFTNSTLAAITSLTQITFTSYTVPSTIQTTGSIYLNIIRNGYTIMTGFTALTGVAGTLTASVTTFTPTTINQPAAYTFSVVLTNPLSGTGCVQITLPLGLSYSSSTCSAVGTSGTINSSPTCTGNTTTIRICNISTSTSTAISAQTLNITIRNITNPDSI